MHLDRRQSLRSIPYLWKRIKQELLGHGGGSVGGREFLLTLLSHQVKKDGKWRKEIDSNKKKK